jgi:hypothetical protein
VNRKKGQLQDKHKNFLINFFDEYPQARTIDAVESLTEAFEEISLEETSFGQFVLHECNLTIKRATFHPSARNDEERLLEERFNWWVKKWL